MNHRTFKRIYFAFAVGSVFFALARGATIAEEAKQAVSKTGANTHYDNVNKAIREARDAFAKATKNEDARKSAQEKHEALEEKLKKAFHLVARASKKAAAPCVLIGGFAINFYKVTRNTLDIDFLTTKEDFAKIKDSLLVAGYAEEFATDATVRLSNKKEALDIDFMIVDAMTREKIIKDGKTTEVVGAKLIIPSINHLIALKLHAVKNNQKNRMWKDMPDIIRLIQMNNIDCKGEVFKKMCLEYGNGEIYQTILKNCGK